MDRRRQSLKKCCSPGNLLASLKIAQTLATYHLRLCLSKPIHNIIIITFSFTFKKKITVIQYYLLEDPTVYNLLLLNSDSLVPNIGASLTRFYLKQTEIHYILDDLFLLSLCTEDCER